MSADGRSPVIVGALAVAAVIALFFWPLALALLVVVWIGLSFEGEPEPQESGDFFHGGEVYAYGDFTSEDEALRFMRQNGIVQMDHLIDDEEMFR